MARRNRSRAHPAVSSAITADDEIGRRIVEAAAAAIVEHGFSGATTDAIARAARTSKRSIYERYPDRDSLFENVMAYLCSQAGERPSEALQDQPLDDHLQQWGFAVLLRFSRPRARRVLAAAIAASPTFPAALDIFWECGPGVAVRAIAERLKAEKRRGNLRRLQPQVEARRFIVACCGPLVLDQLFDATAAPSNEELERHVRETARRFLADWSSRQSAG